MPYIFDHEQIAKFAEGTERLLDVQKHLRTIRPQWGAVVQAYTALDVGEGIICNTLLDYDSTTVVSALARRGLIPDRDFAVYRSKIDAEGNRLPSGNTLPYIKRLSLEQPTL
jgi:hypothetical protein